MTNDRINNINIEELTDKESLTSLINIIHKLSQDIITAQSELDIFNILSTDIATQMQFIDCVVYKVDSENKVLKQVAAYGESKLEKGEITNPLQLKFGQGHAGISAKTGETLVFPDVSKSSDYVLDVVQAGSEMVVPVKIQNKVYAVISSEHPEKNFYKEEHKKLLEVLTSMAAGVLVKIHEKDKLEKVKQKLEKVLHKKSEDLDKAIDVLSEQYAEMKYQNDKQETLMQEVHHRVTNNLQIISSVLRLYINRDTSKASESLIEIYNRVQVMALIHQNIYKSMEMNMVDITSYMNDLMSFLKSTSKTVMVQSNFDISAKHFSLDILVPLGMYITEVFYFWVERAGKNGLNEIDFDISLKRTNDKFSFDLNIKDQMSYELNDPIDVEASNDMNSILISALIDQLEGDLSQGFEGGNFLNLNFKTIV